jgi:heptosyltransferase-2
MAPGAAYGPAKRWPLERFEELARALRKRGVPVVVLGGASEGPLGAALASAGAMDLTGRTTVLEAIGVLARSRALVTNDSGALHLGRAAGTPVIALFGSSSPVWTGPRPEEGTVIGVDLPCRPCFRRNCPLDGADHLACLTRIGVDRVLAALEQRGAA